MPECRLTHLRAMCAEWVCVCGEISNKSAFEANKLSGVPDCPADKVREHGTRNKRRREHKQSANRRVELKYFSISRSRLRDAVHSKTVVLIDKRDQWNRYSIVHLKLH